MADVAFCIKLQIYFSIPTRYNTDSDIFFFVKMTFIAFGKQTFHIYKDLWPCLPPGVMRGQARRKCFFASFNPIQLSFLKPAPLCLNSTCICADLCTHERADLKTRCVQAHCWSVAILRQLK